MIKNGYAGGEDLSRYFSEVRRFSFLTPEREKDLARRWREQRDQVALNQLIGSHLRLVIRYARQYAGYGLPLGDLISQGHLGLMHAAGKFDPERDVRFATYATWWIRAAMQEYVLQSWSLVKIGTTAAQKKLFFNLRQMKSRMDEYDQGEMKPEVVETIARELDVKAEEVRDMNRRLAARDHSLNVPLSSEAEQGQDWQDLLVEDAPDQEKQVIEADELAWRRNLLTQGLAKLNERQRHILLQRRFTDEPVTLEALSQDYGVSRERIRQIEQGAFEKVKAAVLNAARLEQREPGDPFNRKAACQNRATGLESAAIRT